MSEEAKTHSWWQTLPGVFTAIAGIITALAGLVAALYQAGLFQHSTQESSAVARPVTPAVPGAPLASTSLSPADAAHTQAQASAKIPATPAKPPSKSINLLALDAGGHVIVASGDDWVGTIDGKDGFNQISYGLASHAEAVYAFKDEKSATLEMFTLLISGTEDSNIKQFELFAGNDSPTGAFESIGRFQTQNVKLFKTPYQEFRFSPVKAKYLKIRLLSSYGATHPNVPEVQLFGHLESN